MKKDMHLAKSHQGQVMPDGVCQVGKDAFDKIEHTEIRWLGSASTLINSRGINILIDPLLEGFDMPLLFDIPLSVSDVSSVDAILVTHIDNDHFSRMTCKDLKPVCKSYHAPCYVAQVMQEEGLSGIGHKIGGDFGVQDVKVTLTPADHNWQSESPEYAYREWKKEDYCGYWLDTEDGSIWMPGDSRLLEEQLHMPKQPDVILFDFSDNEWHIGLAGAVKLANAYPDAKLICIHWGTVDAPDFSPFNADPAKLAKLVMNPDRVLSLRPGEAFILKK